MEAGKLLKRAEKTGSTGKKVVIMILREIILIDEHSADKDHHACRCYSNSRL